MKYQDYDDARFLNQHARRVTAFLAGVMFGLLYGLISQYINVWALPGIPLYEPAMGRMESIVLIGLSMGLMSLIVGWDQESFWGLLIAALFFVIASSVYAYINSGETEVAKSIVVFVFTFLPRFVFYLPLGLFFRWIISNIEDVILFSHGRLRRLAVSIVAMLAMAVVGGWFSLYSPEALRSLNDANQLLLDNRDIASRANLPNELRPVDGFVEFAKGPYTLEWSSDADSLPVTRPRVNTGVVVSLIIYRFENGYMFGCVFTPPAYKANCIHITRFR